MSPATGAIKKMQPTTQPASERKELRPLAATICSDVRPVIRQSIGDCGVEVPHVFDTAVMPPHPDKRCRCGKQTWKKAEAEMLARRLEEFAATEQRTSPSETVGGTRIINKRGFAAANQRRTRHPNEKAHPTAAKATVDGTENL